MSLQTQVKDNKASLKCQCPLLVPGGANQTPVSPCCPAHTCPLPSFLMNPVVHTQQEQIKCVPLYDDKLLDAMIIKIKFDM